MFGKPNHLKKFEPLDAREFVNFSSFDELSIENLKEACESFFDMPPGTCDALLTERAQFCFLTEQITGKKLYMVHFVDADKSKEKGQQSAPQAQQAKTKSCGSMSDTGVSVANRERSGFVKTTGTGLAADSTPKVPSTAIPKSFCVAHLIAAGKLMETLDVSNVTLIFQSYNVNDKSWNAVNTIIALMKAKNFQKGDFQMLLWLLPTTQGCP